MLSLFVLGARSQSGSPEVFLLFLSGGTRAIRQMHPWWPLLISQQSLGVYADLALLTICTGLSLYSEFSRSVAQTLVHTLVSVVGSCWNERNRVVSFHKVCIFRGLLFTLWEWEITFLALKCLSQSGGPFFFDGRKTFNFQWYFNFCDFSVQELCPYFYWLLMFFYITCNLFYILKILTPKENICKNITACHIT